MQVHKVDKPNKLSSSPSGHIALKNIKTLRNSQDRKDKIWLGMWFVAK